MPIFEIQLVETKQSSQYHTHIHLRVVCEACKQSNVDTEHTALYHRERPKLVPSHESTWFITPMKVAKYYIIDLNNHIPCNESIQVAPIELSYTLN